MSNSLLNKGFEALAGFFSVFNVSGLTDFFMDVFESRVNLLSFCFFKPVKFRLVKIEKEF